MLAGHAGTAWIVQVGSLFRALLCPITDEDLDKSDSFVCRSCNTAIEREQPWLLEHVNKPRDKHDWTHCLLHLPKKEDPAEASDGVEDKIARLEAQVDHLVEAGKKAQAVAQASEASLVARLDRLEALLSRLVDDKIPLGQAEQSA